MSSIDTLEAMVGALQNLFASNDMPDVAVAEGWPSPTSIQQTSKNENVVVMGVVDRGVGSESSTWPRDLITVDESTAIIPVLSARSLTLGASAILSLGFVPNQNAVKPNDAYALIVDNGDQRYGATASAIAGDDLSALAQKLADEIGENESISDLISVVRSNGNLTITNISTTDLLLQTRASNVGTLYREVGRGCTQLQIIYWAASKAVRNQVTRLIEPFISRLKADVNFTLENGAHAFIRGFKPFAPSDKDTVANAYRRDYILDVDYPIIATETVYPVLVPVALPISQL